MQFGDECSRELNLTCFWRNGEQLISNNCDRCQVCVHFFNREKIVSALSFVYGKHLLNSEEEFCNEDYWLSQTVAAAKFLSKKYWRSSFVFRFLFNELKLDGGESRSKSDRLYFAVVFASLKFSNLQTYLWVFWVLDFAK